MFKVILAESLNTNSQLQRQITLALDLDSANTLADTLNAKYRGDSTNYYAKVVPAEEPLSLSYDHTIEGEIMPYLRWSVFTGAEALPEHVAKYWYETTILNKSKA